jgi:hypothetical protein
MKNKLVICAMFSFLCVSIASRYTLNYTVGKGPQKGITVVQKNHYLVAGLAPIKTANPAKMATAMVYSTCLPSDDITFIFNPQKSFFIN